MAAESGEDRISALSDKAVRRVLSFLQAREVVRTCVLSRRWRDIWKSMPVLRITESGVNDLMGAAEFNKFVNHLLFFRDLTPLEEFEFRTYPSTEFMSTNSFDTNLEPVRYFEMWIRYALMRKVRVLRALVNCKNPHLVKVPLIISRHLATLELEGVVLDGCSMDFSRCPLLEDLKMKDCRISAHKMLSQSLRRLCIAGCEFAHNCWFILDLSLFALQLHNNTGRIPFFGSIPLLVSAFIKLPCDWTYRCNDCDGGACIDSYGCKKTSEVCSLLGSLSNATNLELNPGFDVVHKLYTETSFSCLLPSTVF